jgi:hypothetical protein
MTVHELVHPYPKLVTIYQLREDRRLGEPGLVWFSRGSKPVLPDCKSDELTSTLNHTLNTEQYRTYIEPR